MSGPQRFPVSVENIGKQSKCADLRNLFEDCGEVFEVTIVEDYGFVIFQRPDDAVRAIRMMDGKTLDGRRLSIAPSQELDKFYRGMYVLIFILECLNESMQCSKVAQKSLALLQVLESLISNVFL